MKNIRLIHHRRLGYVAAANLRPLPANIPMSHDCSRVVSFRPSPFRAADTIVKNVHAAQRPVHIHTGGSCCFYGVQNDSPLAPLLLWDAAHFLDVGEKITIIEDVPVKGYLDRDYFTGSLKAIARSSTAVTYEKVSALPAESDDDLDSWTFGIPVGPEDATVLNAVVKRILEIDIPNKEILLCGTPGDNFAYFNEVRIVGEDITAPPVQICKKKNRLALEARYKNLVILHDRVFLPRHFAEMVRRFGPRYPLMTLQSMFFDNRLSMHPRRYSDYGMAMGEIAQGLQGLHRRSGKAVAFAPSIFPEIDRSGLRFANPMRYNEDASYPTGSLYICRKEVWNRYPLDESLQWVEYEDIEHGLRASKAGIPTRINPFGITQSITSRALLGVPASVESVSGGLARTGPNYLSMLNKKPLIRMSAPAALAKLHQFGEKYLVNPSVLSIPTGLSRISVRGWVELIDQVIQRSTFRNNIESVREFISDFEKMVLLDQLTNTRQEYLLHRFLHDPVVTKKTLISHSDEIRNMLRQRTMQTWFVQDPREFFHHNVLSLPGILISAIRAYADRRGVFYFESLSAAIQAIYHSTPFRSCLKARP